MTKPWVSALNEFSSCADNLNIAVMNIPDQDLDRSLDENNWSIRQIIHHRADSSVIWAMFFRQALGDPGREFNLGWYWSKTQDEWAQIWNYAARDIASSLLLYRACNQNTLSLLRSITEPGEKSLIFNHPDQETETISINGAVRWQTLHLKQHLAEIEAILGQEQGD
jgi:hypothetical protein